MQVQIDRDQQKVFVDQFLSQVKTMALQLVEQGKDLSSPGETIHGVGKAIISQIIKLDEAGSGELQ